MKTIKRQGERHSFLMTGNALNVLEPNLNLGKRMALACLRWCNGTGRDGCSVGLKVEGKDQWIMIK
jgi:hypothetical protein